MKRKLITDSIYQIMTQKGFFHILTFDQSMLRPRIMVFWPMNSIFSDIYITRVNHIEKY